MIGMPASRSLPVLPGAREPWHTFIREPLPRAAYNQNMAAIDACSALLHINPLAAGRSSHTEFGYALAKGKLCLAFQEDWSGGLRELVYLGYDRIFTKAEDLIEYLNQQRQKYQRAARAA